MLDKPSIKRAIHSMEKNDEKRSIVNYNIFEKINHLKIEIL
jgi:hypothetical protein